MDPATVAGLSLAVVPLLVSAIENYEHTFQPIVIFASRYQKEAKRFQRALRTQRTIFENECCFLLRGLTSTRPNVIITDAQDPSWQEEGLEARIKARLQDNYAGCVSALQLINELLQSIVKETSPFSLLLGEGQTKSTWLSQLRPRVKLSFSKTRLDAKLLELGNHVESLHKIRKHIEGSISDTTTVNSNDDPSSAMAQFHTVQRASLKLYDVLSTIWQCETTEEHFAGICLDNGNQDLPQRKQRTKFRLAWTCPTQSHNAELMFRPLHICIEAHLDASQVATVPVGNPQTATERDTLVSELESALGGQTSLQPTGSLPQNPVSTSQPAIPDLRRIPNLCWHLKQQPTEPNPVHCIGFLQKSKTFKHLIYSPQETPLHSAAIKSLEDALNAARAYSSNIGLPEKFRTAQSLALAVLHFRSTPWLNQHWQSQDVVFFGVEDFSKHPLNRPFLRTRVITQVALASNRASTPPQGEAASTIRHHTPVRNQTLFNLGVMLLELAYDSPLQHLQIPQDDQGDSYPLYWTAKRLAEDVRRRFGDRYADVVKILLFCGFGAATDLDDPKLESMYFSEVVQKLRKMTEAVCMM